MRKIKCGYNPECENEDLEICALCESATNSGKLNMSREMFLNLEILKELE